MQSFEMPEADLSAHPYLRYLFCLCISVLLLACCSSPRLDAQTSIQVPATFDFDRDREPIISLNGVWRFHPGDDGKLGWAKPDFDDSSWPLLRSNTGWGEQGYKGYTGFAWYRFKVLLPNEHRPWAISLPRLLTSYQVFADSWLVGQFGGMPPHAEYVVGFDQIFALPPDLASPGHAVTFAIRVWHWPLFPKGVSGGPTSTTRVGELDALRTQQTYDAWGRFWSSSSGNVLMLMNLLAAFAGLFLFWMRPHSVYRWRGRGSCALGRTVWLRSGRRLIHATSGRGRTNSAELRSGRRHYRAHRIVGSVRTPTRDSVGITVVRHCPAGTAWNTVRRSDRERRKTIAVANTTS
jgi:hypothetical protein